MKEVIIVGSGINGLVAANYLVKHGFCYGDFPGHNSLWEMAKKTNHDVLIRMALVPRVLEARGLDATPEILKKLKDAGDQYAVDILQIIERDEIGHVAKGSHWFRFLCKQRQLDPLLTFKDLIETYVKESINIDDCYTLDTLNSHFLDIINGKEEYTNENIPIIQDSMNSILKKMAKLDVKDLIGTDSYKRLAEVMTRFLVKIHSKFEKTLNVIIKPKTKAFTKPENTSKN